MGVTLTGYSQYANATINVSNSAELNAAVSQLAGNSGGTINVDPNGGPYNLNAIGVGSANSPVLIQSGGNGMPHFESMNFQNSSYIAVDGVNMDSSHISGLQRHSEDLLVRDSSNIEVVNSDFTGTAQGYLSEGSSSSAASGVDGNTGAFVVNSQDVILGGNTFTNHFYGVKVTDVNGFDFQENEVTQFQADGFQAGGLQDAVLANNHLHNALGSTQTIAHSDFIQIRAAGANLQNNNIEIMGNLIDSGSGAGGQGIFMGTAGTSMRSANISIHDNVVHTALPNGIGVSGIDNLEVYNNTVLWNQATQIYSAPGAAPNSWDARILINNATNTQVYDNVSSAIRVNGSIDQNGGYQISYNDPNAANYVDNHFVNVDSNSPSSYNLSLQTGSSLYGSFGAAASSGGTTPVAGTGSSGVSASPTVTSAAPTVPISFGSSSSSDDDTSAEPATSSSSAEEVSGVYAVPQTPIVQNSFVEATPIINEDQQAPAAEQVTASEDDSSGGSEEADDEAPIVTTRVVEAPEDEGSDDEAPQVEAPAARTLVFQAPEEEAEAATSVVEAPVVEAPVVEAPVVEAPVVAAPVVVQPFVLSSFDPVSTVINSDIEPVVPEATAVPAAFVAPQASASGDDADVAADTSGKAADTLDEEPSGRRFAKEKDAIEDDDDSSNFLKKLFAMLFGGGDDDDEDVLPGNGFGRGRFSREEQSLNDIVPVTEWLSESKSSDGSDEDEDEDEDTMIAA